MLKKPRDKEVTSVDEVESISQDIKVTPSATKEPAVSGSKDLNPTTVETVNVLKQKKIADVKAGGGSGGEEALVGGVSTRVASYSGNDAKITGSLAATPRGRGNTRGDGRFGKKLESTANRVADLTSEQVDVFIDGPKPLSENRDAVQGANGVRRNTFVARTKSKGKVPASHMFQRSLDNIIRDRIVFGVGQIIKSKFDDYLDTPEYTMVKGNNGIYTKQPFNIKPRGNYIPKKLKFKLDEHGVVTDFMFEVDDISIEEEDEKIINEAAPHAKIHSNMVELQRRIMDDKAGDESLPGWSPIPRAVLEPNATLSFLKDLEQDTGNVAYMAHRFASIAFAYQNNRVAKDGNLSGEPIAEAFTNVLYGETDSDYLMSSVQDVINDKQSMKDGSPALMLAAFDSLTKYKNKGIIFTHPNGLKQHLFKGQNFMKTFKANPNLVKMMENTHTLSTIDGEYDGVRPVLIDDGFAMVSPFDWNDLFSFSGRTKYDIESLDNNKAPFVFGYEDQRVKYYTVAHHFLLKGIYDWLSRHGYSLVKALGEEHDEDEYITIPIVYSTTSITTWTHLVMAALSDVEKARATSLREILYFENSHGTLFDDLVSLKDYPTTAARGFTFNSIDEPITIGKVPEAAYPTWVLPELFWAADETGNDKHITVVPWYFNEEAFTNESISKVSLDTYKHNMSFPMVRSGIVFEALKNIVDYDERELRLSYDRMIYPIVKEANYANFSVYKYDIAGDGIPAITFDLGSLKIKDFLTVPRELGLTMVAPAGYVQPGGVDFGKTLNSLWALETSYRAKIYLGDVAKGAPSTLNVSPYDNSSINVDRGSLYSQGWYYSFAISQPGARDSGMALSMKEMLNVSAAAKNVSFIEGKSVFIPFAKFGTGSNQEAREGDHYTVVTLQKAVWTRIQLIPFLLNPWDTIPYIPSMGEDGQKYDPYDFAYWFGLAGFASSNFDEDHYDRMDKQIQEGYRFVSDLYLENTPILK